MHHRTHSGSIIDICTDDDSPTSEFLFVHELAHAWDRHALTDDRRQAFLRLRGLDEWQSNDVESWSDHGAEQAAEMVVWALMDRPIWPVYVHDEKCDELARGYVALTGRSPLHGYRDHCERGN